MKKIGKTIPKIEVKDKMSEDQQRKIDEGIEDHHEKVRRKESKRKKTNIDIMA